MNRNTAGNSTYPKGGVSCFADTFVQAESSVLRMKFSGKIPALQVAANRYRICLGDTANNYLSEFILLLKNISNKRGR